MRWGRIVVGVALALATLAAVGLGTRWMHTVTPANEAALRLAWRARVPLVEECRRLTAAEQEKLPAHMRREQVCEGRVASYRLEVSVDGRVVHEATVSGAGARGDRPVYVYETLALDPGQHRLRVSFVRVGAEPGPDHGAADTPNAPDPEAASEGRSVPDRLVLDRDVHLAPRDVVLVTYDAGERRLTLKPGTAALSSVLSQ